MDRRQVLRYGAGVLGLAVARPWLPRFGAPLPAVAITRCRSYTKEKVGPALEKVLDQLGGTSKLFAGKTIAVKLNLTGPAKLTLGGLPGRRSYKIHPTVVAALCHRLEREGAKRILLLESYYENRPPEAILNDAGWDTARVKSAGRHKVLFADTRNRGEHADYARVKVPWGGYLYPAFDINRHYVDCDVLVSLTKMKDHANAGITLAVKNHFGNVPTSLYGGNGHDENSVSNRGLVLHDGVKSVPDGVPQELDPKSPRHWGWRVPRVTADIWGARPADLSIIEAVETCRGGEGPWIKGTKPLKVGVLVAGRNGVSTDAVAAAVMGYDATAGHGEFPFRGQNHLLLLRDAGMGEIDTSRIDVRGEAVADVVVPFNPQREKTGEPLKFR